MSGTPVVRRRIEGLLKKTVVNGCTPDESTTARRKAEEMIAKYGFDPGSFQVATEASVTETGPIPEPEAPKPPQASGSNRGKGIGKLAEQLIVELPDWTYRRIAEEVNARIEGARASEKSVRWYASKMRKGALQQSLPRDKN